MPTLAGKLPEINDLPPPSAVQLSVSGREATVTWAWTLPERHPDFLSFGFEVERQDGKTWAVPATTFSDFNLAFGTYTYRVRALGEAKERGQRLMHVSDWSDPVQGTVAVACGGPPLIQLKVQPYRRPGSNPPAMVLHLSGQAAVPAGCHLRSVHYQVDIGDGARHTGVLPTDANGRFDQTVEALSADDEVPSGEVTYAISATAEDEAGPATSDTYSLQIEKENPFAPRQNGE